MQVTMQVLAELNLDKCTYLKHIVITCQINSYPINPPTQLIFIPPLLSQLSSPSLESVTIGLQAFTVSTRVASKLETLDWSPLTREFSRLKGLKEVRFFHSLGSSNGEGLAVEIIAKLRKELAVIERVLSFV